MGSDISHLHVPKVSLKKKKPAKIPAKGNYSFPLIYSIFSPPYKEQFLMRERFFKLRRFRAKTMNHRNTTKIGSIISIHMTYHFPQINTGNVYCDF